MRIVEQYLAQLNIEKRRWRRAAAILTVLSLMVAVGVSWNLRMTGITIANDATCGMEEHWHSEACGIEPVLICGFEEVIPIGDPAEIPTDPPAELPEELPAEEPLEEELPEEVFEEELPAEEEPMEEELPAEEEPIEEEPIEEEIVEETEDETLPDSIMRAVKNVFSGLVLTANAADGLPEEAFTDDAAQGHVHTDECYEIVYLCGLEEHFHELSCYSDETADLENWDIWEASIPELTGHISEDVVLVAQSQLGSMESTLNFVFADDGETRNGITRYGQWYGNPYGPWSNMFTSFCLYYAGFEEVPANSSAAVLLRNWEEAGLYYTADSYEPLVGDIVFFDKNENGTPEATGIVVDFKGGVLTVIEGDVDNAVAEQAYAVDDPAIIGYGITDPGSRLMMFAAMPLAAGDPVFVGRTINYNANMFTEGRSFVIYAEYDGQYYALSSQTASGMEQTVIAVPIQIENGKITTNATEPGRLLWNFTEDGNNYKIRNAFTGKYLHPGGDNGVVYDGDWSTALQASGTGAKFVHTSANNDVGIRFNTSNTNNLVFDTTTKSNATTLYFGVAETCTVWLDGTQGDLMTLRGSDLTSYSVSAGSTIILPSEWKSPTKYAYELRGWYNVATGEYYEPGQTITVTENMLLYADWRAASYDIGQMNEHVLDTISTNSFITTRIFDYNSLFNTLSLNNNYDPAVGGSSTTWTLVEDGEINATGKDSLNFIFGDHDSDGHISHPNNRNDENGVVYQTVTPGLYNKPLADLLFDPNVDVIGKEYIGTGDYLFHYGNDPSDEEYYGYYYYDSKLNAASYNQSRGRFYVYDYLERTTDSPGNGSYADFLPFNSPYVNTNGNTIPTYTHNGQDGYAYDARYSGDSNDADHVHTDYAMGMAIEMDFYLSAKPGTIDENGTLANQSITGQDMIFEFSGDDDVWVLVDGELVLDIGGIHLGRSGYINFSTGEVVVYGHGDDEKPTDTGSVTYLEPGEHKLTMYYLERGASMSNFKLRFNLTTRYAMTLRKEDTLTAQLLNGAQFAVYTDKSCTEEYAAQLWTSKSAHDRGDGTTNIFTVKNGQAEMWGLAAGNTYYLKEVRGPDAMDGVPSKGIIRMYLNNNGLPDYEVLPEGDDLTVGFTVHGFRVDEENQQAYIVATNAPLWVKDVTTVEARKVWADGGNHSNETISVYLTRIERDENGKIKAVYRLQEAEISAETNWTHIWENLPKYYDEAKKRPIEYGVEEEYVPGYQSKVEKVDNYDTTVSGWMPVTDLNNLDTSKTYLLNTSSGYLSTKDTGEDTGYKWVTQEEALKSNLAQWQITKSGSTYKLTNKQGQIITFYYGNGNYITDFFAYSKNSTNNDRIQYFTFKPASDNQFRIFYDASRNDYYLAGMKEADGKFNNSTTESSGLLFTLYTETTTTSAGPVVGEQAFQVTNTPLESSKVTSLTVHKEWEEPTGDASSYEDEQVTIRLLADGKDTGRTVTVNRRNGWKATFQGLPYYDDNGKVIAYTVEESWNHIDWIPIYGEISTVDGDPPTYETTVTNHYRWIDAVELPATGGTGYLFNILCGVPLVGAPLVYGFRLRRRHERRFKH